MGQDRPGSCLQDRKGIDMFELLISVVFFWLLFKTIGLTLRLTWGIAKIFAWVLVVFALPALIFGLLFAGGVLLFLPLILVGLAAGLVKICL